MSRGQLRALHVDDSLETWQSAGFCADDDHRLVIGETAIFFADSAPVRIAAEIEGLESLDGLALRSITEAATAVSRDGEALRHDNGVVAIDHIVVRTPNSDRTTEQFESQGLEARRVRRLESAAGTHRQTFFWLGDVICEVVGPDEPNGDGPASWWGLALTVENIDATSALLGDRLGAVTPVQPGRRVATLQRSVGLSLPVMFISPHPRS